MLHDVFYARVPVKEGAVMDGFFGGRIEIVANGDGRFLAKPLPAVIPGGACLVEVEEWFLEERNNGKQ